MSAPVVSAHKRERIDVRLTQAQRALYEKAAALRGQTLTQWATGHLDESARSDIEAASTTMLGAEAFETFCALLEEPVPEPARALLARPAVWV